jgi:VAD1 Analog of StAR-related lipid transfer domain
MTLLSCTRPRDDAPAFAKEDAESFTKLTVSTAPSTLHKQQAVEFDNKAAPTSASTISSAASLDILKNASDDEDGALIVNSPSDPASAIPNSCSSPYQAFLFSSDWLGSRDLSRSYSQDKDETDSVVSGGYFEPVDLDSSNWTTAIRMNGPTFGFALVALATALVHPVLFVGVLTAFGTYQAVGAGYEYCNGDGPKAASWEQCLQGICHKEVADEPPQKALKLREGELQGAQVVPLTAASLAAAAATQAANDIIASEQRHATLKARTTAAEKMILSESEEKNSVSPDHQLVKKSTNTAKAELVELVFPSLNTTVVQNVSFPGLHAIEFFRVFFANDAPYNFMELQKERGDLDIVYGDWKELGPEDPVMLHDDSRGKKPLTNDSTSEAMTTLLSGSEVQGRVLTFKAKTNNFIGPVYATTRKTQRVLLCHKTCILMESRTDLSDIPFCNTFYVVERWLIRAYKVGDENGSGKSKYVSTLSATSEVVFTQSCQFASQIKSKSASTIKELTTCWCTMATEALKLTEQRKSLRLKHAQEGESEIDFDETDHDDESNKTSAEEHQLEATKENVPPADDGEGIELCLTDDNARLRHSRSGPLFPASKKHKLQKFRRSVSNMWSKRQ